MTKHPRSDEYGLHSNLSALTIAAIGVVYGDIGTSPLYAMKEVFAGHNISVTAPHVLGVLSLIFWALVLVVSIKYVLFVMRADNRGEGGSVALMALALREMQGSPRICLAISAIGIIGTGLFYGDGVITPAISVLSAVEGISLQQPLLEPYILPIAIVILVGLFMVQRKGTASVGALFGPIMITWFTVLAVLGLRQILAYPFVLTAFNPMYAVDFFLEFKLHGFLALGSIVLVVTGAEALYADMGHFGRKPIQIAWFALVLPALYLNYLGQGALLLSDPSTLKNPFYLLTPSWLLYPMIGLATMATIIASQAVISGAFSLTRQAMQLGYCPRMTYVHTSSKEIGQIYIPAVNWLLLSVVIALVLGFQSSGNLASAYGIAVTVTMTSTSMLAIIVVRRLWRWSWWKAGLILLIFLMVDLAFLSACAVKLLDGGWFPLLLGSIVFLLFFTWLRGRALLAERTRTDTIPLDLFIQSLFHSPPQRVAGTGVFMTAHIEGVPRALLHNLLHNKVLHERVILLTVVNEDVPVVPEIDRVEIEKMDYGFAKIIVRYGFKDEPDIPYALELCEQQGLSFDMMETSFFLGRERLIPHIKPGMALWREKLFIFMFRNASSASDFFKIPANRVIEFGTQVEL